jgi:hypothetical protein
MFIFIFTSDFIYLKLYFILDHGSFQVLFQNHQISIFKIFRMFLEY